uniref:Long-chain-fatty-acid--CoA ligase n=1 Tax=Meloidogyne incognita TaxID=6306 RepID=A0A914LQX4_MELIC
MARGGYFRLKKLQNQMEKQWKFDKSIGNIFENTANRHPEKDCIVEAESGRKISFKELNELANKFGNYFNEKLIIDDNCLITSSDTIGILLENCIEFVALWLGLSKIGVITSWINTHLRGYSLSHSINIVNCKAIITSKIHVEELMNAINTGLLNPEIKIFIINNHNGTNIPEEGNFILINDNELNNKSKPFTKKEIGFQNILAYLYTSGTTGQPKAVIIRHYRYYFMGIAGPIVFDINENDILYITLPMYHGMAGIAGVGQMIVNGSTIVIRQKFSASHFWDDCQKFNCTIAIYIGEICRYLITQPKNSKDDKNHKIRMFCGLGLRPTIWEEFTQRFGIRKIAELYGATEGNATCVNIDNKVGVIGFLPIYTYFMKTTSIRIVKVDPISREYLRRPNGLCQICKPGETGEIVGMIRNDNPTRRFEGYLDRQETDKKIIKNVEVVGDCAFASGDLIYWDTFGYLHFKDRLGDTFRCCGENVSTTEVENVLQGIKGIEELAVYGVEMEGKEGKHGVCSIVLNRDLEDNQIIDQIGRKFKENLPEYAIPKFIKFCEGLEKTGTFKLKKGEMRRNDLFNTRNNLFVWNRSLKKYMEFN